jgi:hypothetical protein
VSVSIGAVSLAAPPPDVETLVHEADRVMYEVKGAGKDDVRCVDAVAAGASAAPVLAASPAGAPRSARPHQDPLATGPCQTWVDRPKSFHTRYLRQTPGARRGRSVDRAPAPSATRGA